MKKSFDLIDYKAIGKRIKRQREKTQMTQETLAEKAGVSAVHISNIENAHTKVSLPTLVAISFALGLSLDALVFSDVGQARNPDVTSFVDDKAIDTHRPETKLIIEEIVVALRDILNEYI